jgi:arsenate reductase-like glutaredoxin family protein
MMQQPNLIRRPILIRGNRVTFGFNKDQYEATQADHTA